MAPVRTVNSFDLYIRKSVETVYTKTTMIQLDEFRRQNLQITDNKERKYKNQIINRFKRIIVYWGYVGTFTGKILPLWQK